MLGYFEGYLELKVIHLVGKIYVSNQGDSWAHQRLLGVVLNPNARPQVQGAIPVVAKVRKIPLALQEPVRSELKRLQDLGIIEEVEATEWLVLIVVARKGDGVIRLCVDLRALNREVVVDRFPLPNIEEIVSTIGGAKHFSTLDLTSAYHQVELEKSSQELTPFGTFKFKRMPFGLVSAASVFHLIMHKVLGNIGGVKCYQDNVLIFADTVAELLSGV
ncbi:hypothetical protein NDU88_000186 [Pleurodeles waltl]|uniref:ribonuclease H n=1 Tax=Pleurodeles waltl TaxID=8319 RepID=A0AAV7TE63_PLEWA|nr:hypothetical protein NDU88_000186 [Pleurodeles waltl]